jgi:TolB-like protein/DNA-binding SARP family transcriptional activator/Flp pilus assembly protein TadD
LPGVSGWATFATVTETLPLRESAALYHLRTLGTLGLTGPGVRQVLGASGHHRRRLALLSVLAASREQGRSRDQLLALFWPESTEARARHSLDQLLYAIRSSVSDDVFAGVNPVRLNSAVVTTDVGIFMAAFERGDAADAVAEYRGPFLDGFYLDDSPEFERWLEVERANFAGRYSRALETLAQNAGTAGDNEVAVEFWRKLIAFEPLSSRNAVGLVRALMRVGDHTTALQCARSHEALLARELGVSPAPELTKLVEELRQGSHAQLASPLEYLPAQVLATRTDAASTSPDSKELTDRTWRPRGAIYVFGLVLVLTMLAALLTVSRSLREKLRSPPPGDRALAVLPLTNVSGAPQDVPIVDGLTEELIGVLSKVPHVRVIARTSAFAFRNSGLDFHRVADSLGVAYVLEGSVQRLGTRVHVQVRLIDARNGVTRWSETYDRELRDVFAVQSDIASGVARALQLQLGATTLASVRRAPTSNVAAYELYLRGNDPSLTRSDSAARVAVGYFERAIVLDPRYAAAYAGLARMQMRLANGKDTTMPRRERLRLGEAAALTAVALDDSLADAHAALSAVRRNNYEFASTEAELRRAVALEPNTASFHEWLVQLYIWMDRPAEALVEARQAIELDPLSPTASAELAHALLANGRCDEALTALAPLRSLQPPLLRASGFAAECYANKGMWAEAITEARRNAPNAGPRGQSLLGFLLARAGRAAEARQVLASLRERARRQGDVAGEIAVVYAGLGDKRETWAWLEQARETRTLVLDDLSLVLDRLRPDPRVDLFRRELGLEQR